MAVNAEGNSAETNMNIIHSLLNSLPAKINEIKSYIHGHDLIHSDRSYDYALVSGFDSIQALDLYRTHPEHIKVLEFIRKVTLDSKSVDFYSEQGLIASPGDISG